MTKKKKVCIKDMDEYQEIIFRPFTDEQDKLSFIKGCIGSMQLGNKVLEDNLNESIKKAKPDADGGKIIELDVAGLGNQLAQNLFDMACLVKLLGLPMSSIAQFGVDTMRQNYPEHYNN